MDHKLAPIPPIPRAATAGKAPKAWALLRFWVSIRSYKKQPVKKLWGRILGFAWLKFAMAALNYPKDEHIGCHRRPYLPVSCNFIEALTPLCLIWENKNDHHQSFCKSLMMDDGIAFNQDCLIAMSTWPVFFERERKPRVWIYGGAHWS